jgi:hypothetical protein
MSRVITYPLVALIVTYSVGEFIEQVLYYFPPAAWGR